MGAIWYRMLKLVKQKNNPNNKVLNHIVRAPLIIYTTIRNVSSGFIFAPTALRETVYS